MFIHAKDGSLADFDEKEIPQKKIEIYSIELIETESINKIELIEVTTQRISKVKGDFRQPESINSWKDIRGEKFLIIKLHIKASSGAYMRTLAQKTGELLGGKALAWKIKRTKIGEYSF